jgi:hypothetical protein
LKSNKAPVTCIPEEIASSLPIDAEYDEFTNALCTLFKDARGVVNCDTRFAGTFSFSEW